MIFLAMMKYGVHFSLDALRWMVRRCRRSVKYIYVCVCVCVCVCVRESEKRKIVCVYEVQFRDLHALDIRWER